MTHRVSLEVQARLQQASKAADDAQRQVFASPTARTAHHLLPQDYADARAKALQAVADLQAAIALMDASERVQWVNPDGSPAKVLPMGHVFNRLGETVMDLRTSTLKASAQGRDPLRVFNRHGEAVRVSIPEKD